MLLKKKNAFQWALGLPPNTPCMPLVLASIIYCECSVEDPHKATSSHHLRTYFKTHSTLQNSDSPNQLNAN